jgi:hypothetical protein
MPRKYFVALMFLPTIIFAQPSFQWMKNITGSQHETLWDIAPDKAGNVFVAGYFTGTTANFGDFNLAHLAGQDAWIAKYNADGQAQWAKRIASPSDEGYNYIGADDAGNVYGLISFNGPMTVLGTAFSPVGADILLVKYSPTGSLLWAKGIASVANQDNYPNDSPTAIYVFPNGELLVAGGFTGTSLSFEGTVLNHQDGDSSTGFLTKYSSAGDVIWAKSTDSAIIANLAVDTAGNIYSGGLYNTEEMMIGGQTFWNASDTSGSWFHTDIFVAKFDNSGNAIWCRSYGGNKRDDIFSLDLDVDGNLVMTALFQGGSIALGETTVSSTGDTGLLFIKLSQEGDLVMAKKVGEGEIMATSGGLDQQGNIYVSGMTLGGNFDGVVIPPASFGFNAFIACFDAAGNIIWTKNAPATNYSGAARIRFNSEGDMYFGGHFSFANLAFDDYNLTNSAVPYADAYLSKIGHASLGLTETELAIASVYFDPVSDVLHMSGFEFTNQPFVIYDTTGREVKCISSGISSVNVSSFSDGVYILKTSSIQIKFIKS